MNTNNNFEHYPGSTPSRRWLQTILAERFGHSFQLVQSDDCVELRLPGSTEAVVFDCQFDEFCRAASDLPHQWWDAEREGWSSVLGGALPAPGASKLNSPLIEKRGADYVVHYDIPGLIFWMLARIEEIGRTDLDEHQRFPAASSHAFKHGYLMRPVVDEWLHILGQVIQRQWPAIRLKQHQFKTFLSHDVDRPSRYAFASLPHIIKRMGGDVLRGNFKSALSISQLRKKTQTRLLTADVCNTFDWIMDQSERIGEQSAFYFICGGTNNKDAEYDIGHPAIRDLLRRIHARGHEIGLHPSYDCYRNPEMLKQQANLLRQACAEEGIHQKYWGGRMHYLRWQQPTTLRAWDEAGMSYDSTLSYADHAGFRCGTCFEYPGFDAVEDKALSVRVRPLVVMEASLFNRKYMNLNDDEAVSRFKELKNKCRLVNGQFSLLWHNSEFYNRSRKEIYRNVITDNAGA